MESKINKSNYLKKYKKHMTEIISQTMSDVDKEEIEEIIEDMIKERLKNPVVTLDNNFTGENRDSTLLSVLDWTFDRKPIIAGNGTFYKNQNEAINPIANMLNGFLTKRKAYKKEMFKIEDSTSDKYAELDLLQSIEKVNANSYYGASGAQSSAFYSLWSAAATTLTAQSVISTAETLFEGFVADNYLFLNLTELLEWCRKVLKQYHEDDNGVLDDEIQKQTLKDLLDRLLKKIIDKKGSDEEILENYLYSLSDDEITILYYKNNMIEFIDQNDYIKELFLDIFDSIENLSYAEDEDENWLMKKVPKEYYSDFLGKKHEEWNKFVNKQYFMDPNDPPKTIKTYLVILNDFMRKYVYCRYLSVDRVYRLKNFKRKVVTVIDTDSNILSLDTIVDFIIDNIIEGKTFNREFTNNIYITINTLAYILTSAVTDILLTYGEYSNVPEEFRPIYNMKNEFLNVA